MNRVISGLVGALLPMIWSVSTQAYTQEDNQFSDNLGNGNAYCGSVISNVKYPCYYWKEPHYTVDTISTYLGPGLASVNGMNFQAIFMQNVFPQVANLPDYAPTYVGCTTTACGYNDSVIFDGANLPCGVGGATAISIGSTEGSSPNLYAFITLVLTDFNTNNNWNTNGIVNAPSCNHHHYSPGDWDAIQTTLHETGHTLGLGHTGVSGRVMYFYAQGMHSYQSDDVRGFNAVYPGNQPAS